MRATVVLVLVNVAIYVAMLATDGLSAAMGFEIPTLLRYGANAVGPVTESDQAWRLFTATLVHINLPHVIMNMLALAQVGRVMEGRWGGARVIAAYVLTGLVASIASLVWYGGLKPALGFDVRPTVTAGASGAICGLIGAAVLSFHRLARQSPAARELRNGMLRWAVIVVVAGLFIGADNAAHVGGLAAGLVMGFVVEKLGVRRRGGAGADVIAIVVFLALCGAMFGIALSSGGG